MDNDKPKPRRYYLFNSDQKGMGSITADKYQTLLFLEPAGHHFYLDNVKVAYFPFDIVCYVTSGELEPEEQK